MRIKPGVRVHGIRPEIVLALMVAESIYQSHGAEVVVTSGIDGQHKRGSKHYAGQAVDVRIWNLPDSVPAETVRAEIAEALAGDYDVVLESDHIHIEFDPKYPY